MNILVILQVQFDHSSREAAIYSYNNQTDVFIVWDIFDILIHAASAQKQPHNFNDILQARAKENIFFSFKEFLFLRKISDGEMSIRTLPTTLLQTFCKIILNLKVIVKSTIDPYNHFNDNLQAKAKENIWCKNVNKNIPHNSPSNIS